MVVEVGEGMLVHLNIGQVYLWAFVICDLSRFASCLRAVADLLPFNPAFLLHPNTFGGHKIPSSSKKKNPKISALP